MREREAWIREQEWRFQALNSTWAAAKEAIRDPGLKNLAGSLQVEEDRPHEVRFSYLGVRWYMRFYHDLRSGTLEYGVFQEDLREPTERRLPLLTVSFNGPGNARVFEEDWSLRDNPPGCLELHKRFLATTAIEAIRAGCHEIRFEAAVRKEG